MHTCIHPCIHTYIHAYIYTYIHTYMHTYMPACFHLHTLIFGAHIIDAQQLILILQYTATRRNTLQLHHRHTATVV